MAASWLPPAQPQFGQATPNGKQYLTPDQIGPVLLSGCLPFVVGLCRQPNLHRVDQSPDQKQYQAIRGQSGQGGLAIPQWERCCHCYAMGPYFSWK
ncbi:uncharacterized protein SPSK_08184 [Sporothrix schenckii 1099-18]|uniref:Uncharacterized protein n=1 Tax=Sporothrix schenckii 1099-18 TaxID=1397361 RepID=A0A0F2MEL2_SPOSC|nr:uncharacterized protein SPSK_08184 [Sporothrix schenckii 1099-18]KJR88067.1 hypothetical protein SPSK_08184 [Sporothrix schenckii 1099-18]